MSDAEREHTAAVVTDPGERAPSSAAATGLAAESPAESPVGLAGGAAPTSPIVDGRVVYSLPCIKCWYDLRTLRVDERCPECGTPVSRTRRSLFASDHRYLRRVRNRMGLSYYSVPGGVVLMLFLVFGTAMLAALAGVWAYLLPVAALPVPMIVSAVGLCRMLEPEGRLRRSVECARTHPSAAVWVWLTVAGFVAFVVVAAVEGMSGWNPFGAATLGTGIVAVLLWVGRNAALVPHLRRVMRRLGLRRNLWLGVMLPLVALGCAGMLFGLKGLGQNIEPWLALATLIAGVWSILHMMMTIGACRRRIDQVLKFRASMGKRRPGV